MSISSSSSKLPVGSRSKSITLESALEEVYHITWQYQRDGYKSFKNTQDILDLLGPTKRLNKLSTTDIDKAVEALRERGNSPGTINRKLSGLSKVLQHSCVRGYIQTKPHIPFQKDKESKKIRWVTKEEEAQILSYFQDNNLPHMYDMTVVLIDTGLRYSELIKLEPEDIIVEPEGVSIYVHRNTKNNTSRVIPLTERISKSRIKLPLTDITSLGRNRVWYEWRKMQKALGLPDVVIHTLRHTFCSRLVQAGVNMKTVQDLAGHESIQTTLRYSHLDNSSKRRAIDVLNGL